MFDFNLQKRTISRADLIAPADYAAMRRSRRPELVAMKKDRRIDVGPHATFYFENYATMWWQIQEMLHIEKGGEEQIADELRAYAPLVPHGHELVATLMFGIEDPVQRDRFLSRLGGVEDTISITVGGDTVKAVAEADLERTRESDGKTSSVHFLHFPFTVAQIAAFRDPSKQVILGIGHSDYGHMALLNPTQRTALAKDFD